ncbi:hypothetical protein [uncultured Dialister sp.]|jgi:hypothetical protein|uniref:hypothetical protein n=1 Tax=uncultured Dialister sp. TaxID=278064 RepID=UPI0025E3BF54|nr:hypothetical protein [uncultured Dialister sp.]
MTISDSSGWLMLGGVEIYAILFILAVIYQNVKDHKLNIFLYIVPILFTALSGINCAMLQLLTSTNLTEIIMGFGHGMDRGTIIMSFGILGIADYAEALYYYLQNSNQSDSAQYAKKQKKSNLLILPTLMIINIGWLYLWKDAVYVFVQLILHE